MFIALAGLLEMRSHVASSHRNDVWIGHFQQSLIAAGNPESTRLDAAERHTRIRGWHDQIVDDNKTAGQAAGERASSRDVT